MRESIEQYGWDKDAFIRFSHQIFNSDWGFDWAIPAYVAVHSICSPYAVFFEAGTSLLYGFFTAVWCVFAAKVGP